MRACILRYIGIAVIKPALWMLFGAPIAHANEQVSGTPSDTDPLETEAARIYRSPDERRDAGLGTQMADWLRFSGLLEVEKEYFEKNFKNNMKQREYGNTITTAQLVTEFSFTQSLGAELIYELEYDGKKRGKWDEAFISFDYKDLGIELGRLSAPFGEFYSHFVTGPLLEFGETIRDGLIVDYSISDFIEIIGFVIDSRVEENNKNTEYDWGTAIEYTSTTEAFRFGLGYLSDLAESDERFLREQNDVYENRVSAWNAYTLIEFEKFEITAELVQANNRFREFERQEDRPFAYNFEFAYFPLPSLQFAARLEGSDEFAEQPKQQYGLSISWKPISRMSVTAEYLHGKFDNDFVFDDDDELDDRDLFAAQISLEF